MLLDPRNQLASRLKIEFYDLSGSGKLLEKGSTFRFIIVLDLVRAAIEEKNGIVGFVCLRKNGAERFEKILRKGSGGKIGNDDELSGEVSKMYYQSLYNIYKDRKNLFGYQWLVGDLLGYNEHHNWFGQSTKATPDGRRGGDLLKFGIGQSEGKDKEGLGALLNAIATLDENAIACGSTVTNVSLDKNLVTNDESFEKLVTMFETYFKNIGFEIVQELLKVIQS